MRKLLIYMKDYKKESVLAPLFKLLEASFELLVPLVMARIIDRGIGNGDKHYVTIMCLLMVSLGIIGLVCSATAQYFAAKAAVGFSTKPVSYTHLDVYKRQATYWSVQRREAARRLCSWSVLFPWSQIRCIRWILTGC